MIELRLILGQPRQRRVPAAKPAPAPPAPPRLTVPRLPRRPGPRTTPARRAADAAYEVAIAALEASALRLLQGGHRRLPPLDPSRCFVCGGPAYPDPRFSVPICAARSDALTRVAAGRRIHLGRGCVDALAYHPPTAASTQRAP